MADSGTTTVEVKVSDADNKEASYVFNVIVYNEAPKLLEVPKTDVYFEFNKE
jgi:hypothetical protein